MQDPALWKRLLSYRFDAPDGTAPFSSKLAKEQGWSRSHTAKVIEEYRKFLYLTQISRGQLSPSEAVDRAWHMHLTFTRDYWDDLGANVLSRPLHHEPSRGSEENDRFNQQYLETRLIYAKEFGRPPPKDVWPDIGTTGGSGDTAFAYVMNGGILFLGGLVANGLGPLVSGGLMLIGIISALIGLSMAAPRYRRGKNNGCGGGGCGGADCGGGGCGGGGD